VHPTAANARRRVTLERYVPSPIQADYEDHTSSIFVRSYCFLLVGNCLIRPCGTIFIWGLRFGVRLQQPGYKDSLPGRAEALQVASRGGRDRELSVPRSPSFLRYTRRG